MELLVAADSMFYKTSDGKYWCKTIYGYNFWLRYLTVFEEVVIVSRTTSAKYEEVKGYLRVDGPKVRVSELPNMRGMKEYIKKYFYFSKAAKSAVKEAECALIRLPSVSASMVLKYFKKTGKPYAIEVVADPFDAYASNKLAQKLYTNNLKNAVLKANGVSYVTKFYLQNKYPSYSRLNGETEEYFETYYSTINLPVSYFSQPRTYNKNQRKFTIVHTANSINNDMKGHEVLINIVRVLREKDLNVNVVFIGDGAKRSYFEKMSKEMEIEESVHFTGLLSSVEEVRDILLNGDIFVFPTKAEGLPRALIEAMAVGLPCLSTHVNGIPELLEEKYLFDPLDIQGFVNKIIHLISNTNELETMSRNNIEKAREYVDIELTARRNEFYSKLRNIAK